MCLFFFFNDTATTEIYTLSLHDALPIWATSRVSVLPRSARVTSTSRALNRSGIASRGNSTSTDRKSTRLNSSHANISYAVFCLKKKKKHKLKIYTTHTACITTWIHALEV